MATYCWSFFCFDAFSSDAMASLFEASPMYPGEDFLDYAVQHWASYIIRKGPETWVSHYGVSSSHSSSARLMEGRTPKHGSDFCFQKVHLPRTLHRSTMLLRLF